MKRRALGRGLDALLREELQADVAEPGLREIPLEQMQPSPFQPRRQPETARIEELSQSIRAQGLVQPVLVRPLPGQDGKGPTYELVAGERRWRAAQLAGLKQIPAVVRELSDQETAAIALIENLQREDLNAVEAAQGFARLHRDFGLTHKQIAEQIGQSRPAVSNLLRLLELDAEVQGRIQAGELSMGHGRALLSLAKPAQRRLATRIAAQGLSVRRTEELVSAASGAAGDASSQAGRSGKARPGSVEDPDLARLERTLSDRFATRVRIKHNARGGGVCKIHYSSLKQLDQLLDRLK